MLHFLEIRSMKPWKRRKQLAFLGLGVLLTSLGGLFFLLNQEESSQENKGLFYQTLGAYSRDWGQDPQVQSAYFAVEFARFETEAEAIQLIQALAEKGVTAFYAILATEEKGKLIYQVRDSLHESQEEARGYAEKLKLSKNIESKVLSF